eukprot:TRINITY_DN569_c0_g1_i1.p1 TRINITY_DN569_c0_g1~~TRINITY_DN569_c0_g1_i1.p1  ORF type:complete len:230 (+),score=25.75 TRINITY_DN569_c0_g1_i1:76-765(+)
MPQPLQVSNLMKVELWAQARMEMGVEGKVGWAPGGRIDRDMKERGLGRWCRDKRPAIGVVEKAKDWVQQGMDAAELEGKLREICEGSLVVRSGTTVSTCDMLCQDGISYLCLLPVQASGRTVRFPTRKNDRCSPFHVLDSDTLFVVPHFASYWAVPAASSSFQEYYEESVLPYHKHFVGTASKLFSLLDAIEAKLSPALPILPPWRTAWAWKKSLAAPESPPVSPRASA